MVTAKKKLDGKVKTPKMPKSPMNGRVPVMPKTPMRKMRDKK